jgi:cytidylate kinase
MRVTFGFDQCRSFINSQLHAPMTAHRADSGAVKCVTVSRQSGCGAHVFAEELAARLQSHLPSRPAPWTIFDGDLVEAVLRDHNLPERLAAFMPEDKVPQLNDIVENLLSLHPPTETLVRQSAETILRLADLGNVIIIGRGATVITARLPDVLHVRLIGSAQRRISHMKNFDHISESEALRRIAREDGGRARYVRRYFHENISDPLHYNLVINTDCVTLTEAAEMVSDLAVKRSGVGTPAHARVAA